MGIARDISKLFSADTSIVTSTELTSALQNVTVDLSGYVTASAVSASIANIDVTASLNSRIFISSASPSSGNTNGRLWIDTSTASAPVLTVYGQNSFRSPRFVKSKGIGGTITYSGAYTIHTFIQSGTFTAYEDLMSELLVVAGGGGGGIISSVRGAGGGAGGFINIASFPLTSTSYNVTIGSGGGAGSKGSDTILNGGGRTVTALGGGSGGYNDNTNNGTSGGSGGGQWYIGYAGAAATQPSTTSDGITSYPNSGFGNAGGTSGSSQPYGSGGGGAGAVGSNFNATPVGGIGRQSSISGTATYYAGGGGAAGFPNQADPPYVEYNGGLGGGGRGSNDSFDSASNGTANLGGGGGSGGSGGSGVIIIRYLT